MEELDPFNPSTPTLLKVMVNSSLTIFGELINYQHSENEADHIINYCNIKMKHAKQLIENDNIEEGLPFSKSVLVFFLRDL